MKFVTKICTVFIASIFIALFLAESVKAVNIGEYVDFNVDQNYDMSSRSRISATLIKTTSNLYFYVEKDWWAPKLQYEKDQILSQLEQLSDEFNGRIYPVLTSTFGSEWSPGIDNDRKIAILIHPMKKNVTGYFRTEDEYDKLQAPSSNQREMLYLATDKIGDPNAKVFLAHEFVHLITFNQKDKLRDVAEEVWLNEARADYAPTLLGYDNVYPGSNLEQRVKDFLQKPDDSLTEWKDSKYDYGVANVFIQYLVEHYGINILSDSLKSKSIGINSINESLLKSGAKEDFAQIFTNWTIAIIINNCSIDLKYCYSNQNLSNLRINPNLIFLPVAGNSYLSTTNATENWAGNWQKIIGGNGDLKLVFSNSVDLNFKVPYIIFDKSNNYSINFLTFNESKNSEDKQGEINIKDFNAQYDYLIITPSLQTKKSGFDGSESTYSYMFTVSTTRQNQQDDAILIQKLLAQIDSLKRQIAALQNSTGQSNLCTALSNNLYSGIKNYDVKCLQQFLKSQGQDIYPEGLVTGYFGNLTKSAVIRFQEKYKTEILNPVGLSSGTGFVGSFTRQKINQLLK